MRILNQDGGVEGRALTPSCENTRITTSCWTVIDRKTLEFTKKDTGTPMLTAALFTTARTWKQPKCPSIEQWIKKMWYIYTMEYYSAIKRRK